MGEVATAKANNGKALQKMVAAEIMASFLNLRVVDNASQPSKECQQEPESISIVKAMS